MQIIKLTPHQVFVGQADGNFEVYNREQLQFEAKIGDVVRLEEDTDGTIRIEVSHTGQRIAQDLSKTGAKKGSWFKKVLVVLAGFLSFGVAIIGLGIWLVLHSAYSWSSEQVEGWVATEENISEIVDHYRAHFDEVRVDVERDIAIIGGNDYDRRFVGLTANGRPIDKAEVVTKNSKITIRYTDFPEDWLPFSFELSDDAETLAKQLKSQGFTKVSLTLDKTGRIEEKDAGNIVKLRLGDESVETDSYHYDYKFESITGDGQSFEEGSELLTYKDYPRYYPRDTEVEIVYKERAELIDLPTDLALDNYQDMVDALKKSGFASVKTEAEETFLSDEDGHVYEVLVDGQNIVDALPAYLPKDKEIVIRYLDYGLYQERLKKEEEERRNPANYGSVDFDAWNHDEVENGTKVAIRGEVIQNSSGLLGSRTLRVAINGQYSQVILAEISAADYESVLAEDDWVTLYGTTQGLTTYTTVWGAERTIPELRVEFYERN